MSAIDTLQKKYRALEKRFETKPENAIDTESLMAFDYEYAGQEAEIVIASPEFTAVCPWTGLPDFGTLTINYVPDNLCLELKSLKYYLLSYTSVGIVQEHAANRILKDLVDACRPARMEVHLDYNVRGGLHTTVTVRHQK